MLDRRNVLKGLAAFVAAAAIPETAVEAFVAEARDNILVHQTDLPAGRYTFSCFARHPGANWVKVERDIQHAGGTLTFNMLEMIENADRIITEGISTTGPGPDHLDVRWPQLATTFDADAEDDWDALDDEEFYFGDEDEVDV